MTFTFDTAPDDFHWSMPPSDDGIPPKMDGATQLEIDALRALPPVSAASLIEDPATQQMVRWVEPTGSRFICEPPVMDTDADYLVFTTPDVTVDELLFRLADGGWEVNEHDRDYTAHGNEEVPFGTARRGEVNLIVYDDIDGYIAFRRATVVARALNLRDKDQRKLLFRAVCGHRLK